MEVSPLHTYRAGQAWIWSSQLELEGAYSALIADASWFPSSSKKARKVAKSVMTYKSGCQCNEQQYCAGANNPLPGPIGTPLTEGRSQRTSIIRIEVIQRESLHSSASAALWYPDRRSAFSVATPGRTDTHAQDWAERQQCADLASRIRHCRKSLGRTFQTSASCNFRLIPRCRRTLAWPAPASPASLDIT